MGVVEMRLIAIALEYNTYWDNVEGVEIYRCRNTWTDHYSKSAAVASYYDNLPDDSNLPDLEQL